MKSQDPARLPGPLTAGYSQPSATSRSPSSHPSSSRPLSTASPVGKPLGCTACSAVPLTSRCAGDCLRSARFPASAHRGSRPRRRRSPRLRKSPAPSTRALRPLMALGCPCHHHRSSPRDGIASFCAATGWPRLPPRQLRHFHASLLIAQGLPVTLISRRLDHAWPEITMRVYARWLSGDDSLAAEAILAALTACRRQDGS